MNKPIPGAPRASVAPPRQLSGLGARTDLPVRVRTALEGVLDLCSTQMQRSLSASLNEFEQQLFKLAEQSHNNEAHQRCFESLREVKRGRADVAPRFFLALEDSLASFDRQAAPTVPVPQRTYATARQELTLIESGDLEESLALQEMAAKSEIRQTQPIYALGHRFGVLAGAPALDVEALPIGPAKLCAALRHAAECLVITPEHRVLFYRTFDRMAMNELGSFYEILNAYFVDQRILKNLRLQPPRSKHAHVGQPAAEISADEASASANTENAVAPPPAQASPATPARPQYFGGQSFNAQAGMPRQPSPSNASVPMPPSPGTSAPAGNPAPRPWEPGGSWNMPAAATHGAPSDERDSELFTTLRELLSGRRNALGIPRETHGAAFVPSPEDVQSVLGALQSKPLTPHILGGKVVHRSVPQLKQEMLAQLRQFAPDGKSAQLGGEDSDTIDLVGMLFDSIMKDGRPTGHTQSMLAKLQVPLLRVALHDKSFFTRRAHPARQLLNAIAETGIHWMDETEGEVDGSLAEKMQLVIDRVTHEFDGNLGLIEELLGDLSQHMQLLARKAEASERRHVNAAKGREKLALARETAFGEIAKRISVNRPGPLVRTLLEQSWTDVLALTLLRQGENSEAYKKQLDIADQLITASTATKTGATVTPAPELREEVENGLSQVGFHQDDIQAVVKRLFVPESAANEDISQTDLAIKLKSKARLGDEASSERPMHAAAKRRETLQLNAEEKSTLDRLRTVPFGTWFEFTTNQQGERVRRRLSWFSPMTGRCLFVNQRGARADERSLEQLARDMVRGQASITKAEPETLVDRAWKAIVSSLKHITGRGLDPEPVPA